MKTDKGDCHSYLPIYEEILKPYRSTATNVLEIGIFNGASLLLWEKYFDNAKIHGIDCDVKPHGGLADLTEMIASGDHNIYIGDAANAGEVNRFFLGMEFDVVIIDASHDLEQEIEMFHIYKNYVKDGGIMVIEDPQNLDRDKDRYTSIHNGVEIIDLRKNKGRYDDALIIYKF